jgi:putative endonuclease
MAGNKPYHLKQGELAEATAATFLQAKGLTLLERNFHCRYGEIDLIMRHAKTLVFIEVRLRSHAQFGGAAMSINQAKQEKLRRAAEYYLQTHNGIYGDTACRFDAILMQDLNLTTVEWIQNAF